MADFKIVAPEPFEVEGVNGDVYSLPRIKDLSSEQVAAMGNVQDAKGVSEQVAAQKAFILSLCPELANEPLADMGYVYLFKALAEGSDIAVGES